MVGPDRKIQARPDEIEALLIEVGIKAIPRSSGVIVLDFDATGDPIHGDQDGKFFPGYSKNYCYPPLYWLPQPPPHGGFALRAA